MKRSDINEILGHTRQFFSMHDVHLPSFASFPPTKWQQLDQSAWREVFDLKLGWDVTAFDWRGQGGSQRFTFEAPADLARFIASKGSVALDGVSLTVNETDGPRFGVNLIAHTLASTTFGAARVGDRVNLEIDMLARYVARLLDNA